MSLAKRIFNKILRIIEGPPVRDRVVVKVVDTSKRSRSVPCFLIGVYRSGTTLLRYILDSHSMIAVPPETNFLHSAADIWHSEWIRKGLQGVGVDEAGLIERLRDFASSILDDYAVAKGKARWIDKTPSYVDILDFIDLLFGKECRYIMLYRHGLDVANSIATMHERDVLAGPAKRYVDEYKQSPRLAFAHYWVDQCEKMLAFEDARQDQCFRIHYEQFARNPEAYIPPLFEFLGEEWEPGVLNFNKKQHDFGLQDSKILETNRFKPNIGTYNCWSVEEIAAAKEITADTMMKLGYEI